jgi:hypothetical protein
VFYVQKSWGNHGSLAGFLQVHNPTLGPRSDSFQENRLKKLEYPRNYRVLSNSPFTNPILNRAWETFPRFLMWNVWKERNRRILKENNLPIPKYGKPSVPM